MVMFLSVNISAQVSNAPRPVSNTYLLKNCHVVPAPGRLLHNQNILIQQGVIKEVGTDFKVPFDAMTINADSLYVYAGFIDGYSHTGIAKPDKKDMPKKEKPDDHPFDAMGVTPHLTAQTFFKSADKTVSELRRAGVTVSHIAPRGGMLSGKTDVIILGQKHAESLTIRSSVAQHFQLVPASGTFPSTIIGVMAQFQDIYTNASLAGKYMDMYDKNPAGLVRPAYHNAYAELYPTTTGSMPYVIPANHTRDIYRILDLQQKMKFKLILADVKQGWHVIEQLKTSDHGLFLSLDLPDIKKEKKDSTNQSVLSAMRDEEAFYQKKDSVLLMYHRQASLFEKEGIEFGFSFHEVKPDKVGDHIRSMISHGLTHETALKALTTYPAKCLGIDKSVGTVEKGKLAHLVVFDKPFYDDKAQVKYVFVDGEMHTYEQKTQKKAESNEVNPYLGNWSYSIDIPGDTRRGTMDLYIKDNVVTVRMTGDDSSYSSESDDVVLDGNSMTFSIVVSIGQDIRLDYRLTFEKESFTGQVDVENFGTYAVSGTKFSKPDRID